MRYPEVWAAAGTPTAVFAHRPGDAAHAVRRARGAVRGGADGGSRPPGVSEVQRRRPSSIPAASRPATAGAAAAAAPRSSRSRRAAARSADHGHLVGHRPRAAVPRGAARRGPARRRGPPASPRRSSTSPTAVLWDTEALLAVRYGFVAYALASRTGELRWSHRAGTPLVALLGSSRLRTCSSRARSRRWRSTRDGHGALARRPQRRRRGGGARRPEAGADDLRRRGLALDPGDGRTLPR